MSEKNKEVIRKVNAGFMSGDNEAILSHLTDDVRWHINGKLSAVGKEEFRKEINNEAFEGIPVINVTKEIAEDDYVAAEGTVQSRMKGGAPFEAFFFDIYRLENGKIKEMRSYVVEKK
ncbi:MAG: nuclear transport factor 2 family protein [Bacteroidia bacterium]